ncbi:uncharacterized protein Z519_12405 [Cladophialophora bantiana CBS 173.52]|uniref:Uncharacterized protein n=1 Tax=Cladophialophora bantiana (strain ATCC 10958 / CBS 173.52 / CDC B-1940 / NIH 8579) TaxID=1442370 RepID=A0A0D2H7V6_CLAB1|nr:uncharacterized protein Z519_12405 [Cladophialophora bantiana CBS 173.52]KIW86940.1 hypothetical protein Z519_12405 [Cladophialophora bantiana CBS 173.52]
MSTAPLGIEEPESRKGGSNGLLYRVSSPSRDVSGPSRYPIPDVVMPEGKDKMPGQGDRDAKSKPEKPRLTIRELREAAQKESLASQAVKAGRNSPQTQRKSNAAAQKKKPSIFGGLFQVREPTQIALDQVAAQMIAQHGSTSATKVPNVRLEKMPDFVPKVNSKWDGIPDSARRRERKEKEKENDRAKKQSFFFSESNARSGDGKDKRRTNVGSRNSSSTTGSSFGPHGNSSGSQGASSRTRFFALSVCSSGDLASQQRTDASTFSPSLTPPSALSLTESLSEKLSHPRRGSSSAGTRSQYPHCKDVALESRSPIATGQLPSSRVKSAESTINEDETPKSLITNRHPVVEEESSKSPAGAAIGIESSYIDTRMESARSQSLPAVKLSPLYPISAFGSSQDASPPITSHLEPLSPSRQGANEITSLKAALVSSGPGVLSPPAVAKKKSGTKFNNAFLAGEAQELVLPDDIGDHGSAEPAVQNRESGRSRIQQDLEKRPDSSRDRLGLRASMLLSDDVTPWEWQDVNQPPPSSPKFANHAANTKAKFHKPFGRIGKEKEKWKVTL